MLRFSAALLAATCLVAPAFAQAPKPAPVADLVRAIDIPYEQFTLANGLRVVVHTDRKAPVVAVSVWYDVGSKNEPAGKTGFAHLFEHLMFNGSENACGETVTKMTSNHGLSINRSPANNEGLIGKSSWRSTRALRRRTIISSARIGRTSSISTRTT